MKKKIFVLGLLLGVIGVKADMGAPSVVSQEVMVANKDGAYCYNIKYDSNGRTFSKTDKKVPYGKTFKIWEDVGVEYVGVSSEGYYDCYVSANDVVSKNDEFDITSSKEVQKIDTKKAIILKNDGVLLKKGPGIAFSTIATIPKGSIINISYRAGTYWFYAEYNGLGGWVNGQDEAFAYDDSAILIYPYDNDIYDSNKKVIGKIPAYEEITDYLELVSHGTNNYYVNYKGIIGSIYTAYPKVNGKLRLKKDIKLYEDVDGKKLINTIKKGTECDYSLIKHADFPEGNTSIYVPSLKGWLIYQEDYNNTAYEEIGETKVLKKEKGYLGEGLFGENVPSKDKDNPSTSMKVNNNDLVMICVIGAIILSVTIIVVIKLVNKKKNK